MCVSAGNKHQLLPSLIEKAVSLSDSVILCPRIYNMSLVYGSYGWIRFPGFVSTERRPSIFVANVF